MEVFPCYWRMWHCTVISSVSASHTLCFLLRLCFGESFDKEDCFWNSQLSLWMIGIKNLITKGVCLSAVSSFLLYVIHRGRFFSFHFIYEVLLFILTIYYLLKIFLVARCGLWDLVPWSGIVSRPPSVEAWSPNHLATREFPYLCQLLMFNFSQIFYFGQKYFMGEHKTLEVNIAIRIWVCLIYFV